MMMKKIVKRVLAAAMAVCMMAPMAGISVCAASTEPTQTTTVNYVVENSYNWTVPSTITLGPAEVNDTVSVTSCVIPSDKKLQITAVGSGDGGAFTVAAGSQTLEYEITVGGTSFTSGGVVLEVNAGDTGTAALAFKLTGTAKYAGTYEGRVTYTAEVVNQ